MASNLPVGAEHDPYAPYNQVDPDIDNCDTCDATGYQCFQCEGPLVLYGTNDGEELRGCEKCDHFYYSCQDDACEVCDGQGWYEVEYDDPRVP